MIPFAARTHSGLKRSNNEDSFAAEADLGLWVVADGVGGHSYGEVASAIACATICQKIREGALLCDAVASAHLAVLAEIDDRGGDNISNMGTTVVALRLQDKHYEIAWVGDSRAYLFDRRSGASLKQLTVDHSAVNDLVANGAITKQQASTHPQRHALSRSLGVSRQTASEGSLVSGKLKGGQQILLCSDGLTEELRDPAITQAMMQYSSLERQADALVSAALAGGGRDNITVVIVGQSPDVETERPAGDALETTQRIRLIDEGASKSSFTMNWQTVMLVVLLIVLALAALS